MITEIKTIEAELECEIKIIIRGDRWGANNENWGVQIDNKITPIYCCNCKKQLNNLYRLDGSRYGQVGFVACNCGAEIHCVDSDNIVEYIDTATIINDNAIGKYFIDFKSLYKLDNSSFLKIKDNYELDIFEIYKNQTVDLRIIIDKIEEKIQPDLVNHCNHSSDIFERLPMLINKWFDLLNYDKKTNYAR